MRILIIRLSAMGDIILTTPIVRFIKNSIPNCTIDFLVTDKFSDIFTDNPYIDNIILYDKSLSIAEIKLQKQRILNEHGKYDIIIDLQNNLRSKIFKSGLADKYYKIQKRRLHKLLLVNLKRSIFENRHIVDNYCKAIEKLTIKKDKQPNQIFIDGIDEIFEKKKTTIAIAPGAHHFTKRLPISKYVEIINNIKKTIDFQLIIVGGKQDIILGEQIIKDTKLNDTINLCGSLSIRETAKAISRCDAVICNDTGVMHIASCFDIPIAAIFGSTVQELGFTPYNSDYKVFEVDLNCRPCSHIGKSKCPKGHFNCMNLIDTNDISEWIIYKISKSPK